MHARVRRGQRPLLILNNAPVSAPFDEPTFTSMKPVKVTDEVPKANPGSISYVTILEEVDNKMLTFHAIAYGDDAYPQQWMGDIKPNYKKYGKVTIVYPDILELSKGSADYETVQKVFSNFYVGWKDTSYLTEVVKLIGDYYTLP